MTSGRRRTRSSPSTTSWGVTRSDDLEDIIDSGVDRLLADARRDALPKLAKPFFAMVHLSGTHAPYFVDDTSAPFRPYRTRRRGRG